MNKQMSFIVLIMILLFNSTIDAAVSATIDRNPVRVNETFELTLHMESAPVTRPPLENLPAEIEIVRSTNFYQSSTINGKTNVQAGWRFILKALAQGIYTIPSFTIDGHKTLPMQIKVLPPVSSKTIGGQQDAIKLTATIDNEDIYVQQQIIYTIKLFRAVQAQYASLTEPVMEGAILERLGEDKQYETTIDSVRYIVLERQYAIYPQQKGKQTISPVIFSAEVSDGNKRYSNLGRLRSRTTPISLSTKELEINVKGQPTESIDWWLPAKSVKLTQEWLPSPLTFQVGEPVTWSYTIEAEGLTATQLPELLPQAIDGLKFYPDKAVSFNKAGPQGIIGSRIQKIAVVPTKAGRMNLPEIKVSWWNVSENEMQEITLPSREINILPSADSELIAKSEVDLASDEVINSKETSSAEQARLSEKPLSVDNNNTDISAQQSDDSLWKMIALTSLLLWLISALILTIRGKKSQRSKRQRKTVIDEKPTTLAMIREACKKGSALEVNSAILKWCSTQPKLNSIYCLAELANHLNSFSDNQSELAKHLTELEIHLYSSTPEDWKANNILSSLNELKTLAEDVKSTTESDVLPPLHLTQ